MNIYSYICKRLFGTMKRIFCILAILASVGIDAQASVPIGSEVALWDEFHPQLYHIAISVCNDYYETTFGMREIAINGRQFYINGRPIWLRGTVESCCFPETGYPPTDVDAWTRISREHMLEMKAIRDEFDPCGGRAIGSREMLDINEAEYGGEMLYINKSKKHPMWAMEYCRDEGLRKYWDDYSYPFHKEGDGPLYRGKPAREYNHNMDQFAVEMVRRWYDYWLERPGTGTRVSSGGVKIVFSDTNTHHRGESNFRMSGVTDAMRIPKDAFYAHQVEVVDKQGRRCPLDDRKIHFELWGEGHWIGGIGTRDNKTMQRADTQNRDGLLDAANTKNVSDNHVGSYDLPVDCGINRVLVRTTTNAGEIHLSAYAEGVKPAASELDLFKAKGGMEANSELRIVEIEFNIVQ